MTQTQLHVVAFNVPWPADYGGVIDVFYKLKALKELGANITLHCFHYGRPEAKELEEVCTKVLYYRRVTGLRGLSATKPYIISSRRSKELLAALQADDAPILFEGLHCCYYIDHPSLKDRVKAVRLHNVEWEYYRQLAKAEKLLSVRTYLQTASRRLKKFERRLLHAQILLPIAPNDSAYYKRQHANVHYLPAFHPNERVETKTGTGDYCLYHGNLSVNENHEAAMFLLERVFKEGDWQVTLAGKEPRRELIQLAAQIPNVVVEADPSRERMRELVANAQVHVLPTFQSTGIKLKLLNTLFAGRAVIANAEMVNGTGLNDLCVVANSPDEWKAAIQQAMKHQVTNEEIEKRTAFLDVFNNHANAAVLIKILGEV